MNILVTGSTMEESIRKVYQNLNDHFVNVFYANVQTPLDTIKFQGTNEERVKRAFELVDMADVIIADVSFPSHGQGIELHYAYSKNKKIILIAKENSKVSGVVLGLLGSPFYYNSIENLVEFLDRQI